MVLIRLKLLKRSAAREQMLKHVLSLKLRLQLNSSKEVPPNFQRPQMDMPQRGGSAAGAANDFWGDFSQLMDQNPENAWQYLSQAPQGALQTKMLVQDL